MSASDLISRLEKVRESSRGNWTACCPAHPDKNPSMVVRECDDGRVLIHCFAGCSPSDILGAVALDFDALFPEKPIPLKDDRAYPRRVRIDPQAILDALVIEITIAAIIAGDLARGETPSDADRARLVLAAERIEQGRRLSRG